MRPLRAAILLTIVQLLLVLSIAGKYLYERHTRPRIWIRTGTSDPGTPLRGRYLALQLVVDACSLPRDAAHFKSGYRLPNGATGHGLWVWSVSFEVKDGKYQPVLTEPLPAASGIQNLSLFDNQPCNRVTTPIRVPLYIPDTATIPFPLKPGHELWVEATIPNTGPPRPIQLALSAPGTFTPIHFN